MSYKTQTSRLQPRRCRSCGEHTNRSKALCSKCSPTRANAEHVDKYATKGRA